MVPYPDSDGPVPLRRARFRTPLAAVGVLCAWGCSRSPNPSQAVLPTQLSVLAERQGAAGPEPVSLVLDLRRNSRDQLDVRVAPGLRLWDGKHLWELQHSLDARGHGLRVTDLKAGLGGDVPLFGDAPLDVVGMTRRDVFVGLPNHATFRCELARPACEQASVEPLPMSHPGPGHGFQLGLADGTLTLRLPYAAGDAVLLDHVLRLVGVHWVHEAWLDHDPLLDRTYRGRGTLAAVSRAVSVDGDMHDWADAEPMVVDAPWQVESGAEDWSGPRDASFSIAAGAPRAGSVCFAGRVRDDDWTAGDGITLHVGPSGAVREVRVALAAADGGLPAPTDTARVTAGWYSRSFEVCVADPGLPTTGEVPFAAELEDHDAHGTTVLASAPRVDGAGQGALRLGS